MLSSEVQFIGVSAHMTGRPTDLGDHHRLDAAGVGYVRPGTKVDHRATAVDGGGFTILNLRLDKILLVFVVLD